MHEAPVFSTNRFTTVSNVFGSARPLALHSNCLFMILCARVKLCVYVCVCVCVCVCSARPLALHSKSSNDEKSSHVMFTRVSSCISTQNTVVVSQLEYNIAHDV